MLTLDFGVPSIHPIWRGLDNFESVNEITLFIVEVDTHDSILSGGLQMVNALNFST